MSRMDFCIDVRSFGHFKPSLARGGKILDTINGLKREERFYVRCLGAATFIDNTKAGAANPFVPFECPSLTALKSSILEWTTRWTAYTAL
jgi:hypothetical protein